MFIVFSILFIFIGILLLIKSKKMEKAHGTNIVVGLSAIVMVILGIVLICYALLEL